MLVNVLTVAGGFAQTGEGSTPTVFRAYVSVGLVRGRVSQGGSWVPVTCSVVWLDDLHASLSAY